MKIIDRIFNKIISIRINYIVFPKEIARSMPIYCSWHVKWIGIKKGSILLESDQIYKGMIQIGFDRIAKGLLGGRDSIIDIEGSGQIVFKGKADLSQGISLRIADKAQLSIGGDFYSNGYCSIKCRKKITIGNGNMWGWNVVVMDTDGHPIYDKDHMIINGNKEIQIGENVWLASYSKVLKGAIIPSGCIVGMGSLVTRQEQRKNVILAGIPARVMKEDITWDRGEFPEEYDCLL